MPNKQLWRRQAGFSIVELMFAMAVLAVLVAVAIPSFQGTALTGQLRTAANNLLSGAILARSEAIKRNTAVTLCVSTNGTSCGAGDWESGWIVACRSDDNTNCTAAGASWLVFQREAAAPSGMKITATGGTTQINFQPTGVGANATTLKVCRMNPLGDQERLVVIDAVGRGIVRKAVTGTCP